MRRTDRRPLARPRSIASPKAGCFFRRSIVRVLTLKNEATSASVHCSPHSFSSSTRLMFTALRPDPRRAPPAMLLLWLSDIRLGILRDEPPLGGPVCQRPAQPFHVRVPTPQLPFDLGDLGIAPFPFRHAVSGTRS